jgi:hypothetical protein
MALCLPANHRTSLSKTGIPITRHEMQSDNKLRPKYRQFSLLRSVTAESLRLLHAALHKKYTEDNKFRLSE